MVYLEVKCTGTVALKYDSKNSCIDCVIWVRSLFPWGSGWPVSVAADTGWELSALWFRMCAKHSPRIHVSFLCSAPRGCPLQTASLGFCLGLNVGGAGKPWAHGREWGEREVGVRVPPPSTTFLTVPVSWAAGLQLPSDHIPSPCPSDWKVVTASGASPSLVSFLNSEHNSARSPFTKCSWANNLSVPFVFCNMLNDECLTKFWVSVPGAWGSWSIVWHQSRFPTLDIFSLCVFCFAANVNGSGGCYRLPHVQVFWQLFFRSRDQNIYEVLCYLWVRQTPHKKALLFMLNV